MDLSPTPAELALREEIRAWLRANLPWEYGKGLPPRFDDLAAEVAFGREWQAKLASGRLVGVGWPEEYGGRGAGPVEHYIVTEELARARAGARRPHRRQPRRADPPRARHRRAESALAPEHPRCERDLVPAVQRAGSGQRPDVTADTRRTDRRRLRAQRPEGLDELRAVRGLGLVPRGTNMDAPKSKGISALVVDMHAPGVEVRPLRQITDETEFNEVFFTDVFVPDDRLVGPRDEGWRIANSTLTHERGVNPRQLVVHSQLVDELWRIAQEHDAFADPRLAPKLAQAFVEVRLFQLHNWRSISCTAKGADPGAVGAINKLWWSEMSKRLHDTAMSVLGPSAPLWRGATGNPGDGAWQRSWLYYQAASIWAGTNEIQRNVVAERTLGLPREPKP